LTSGRCPERDFTSRGSTSHLVSAVGAVGGWVSRVQRSSELPLYLIIPSGYQSFQIFLTSFHLVVPLRIVPPDSATAYRTQHKKKSSFWVMWEPQLTMLV
jgi:hypothetical protein